MNHCEQCLKFDPLVVVTNAIESPVRLSWLESIRYGYQRLVDTLARTNEPRVWQRIDRLGHLYWQAYDPATGRSTASGSEAEIRAWIEQLYNR